MTSVYRQINQVFSFGFIPYILIALFTISYFIYEKYWIIVQIRNIPAHTIFSIDLSKVKKNLQIKSLTYNFILIISSIECAMFITSGIVTLYLADLGHSRYYNIVITTNGNTSCLLPHYTYLGFAIKFVNILEINIITLITLFFIVLRMAFINLPYTGWIEKFSAYILLRSVFLLLLACFLVTSYFIGILLFLFAMVDSYLYIKSCWRFYILLKGRRDEARWHSTRRDYIEKRIIFQKFVITQSGVFIIFIVALISIMLSFLVDVIRIIQKSQCLFQYIFHSTTPVSIQIPIIIQHSASMLENYCEVVCSICCVVLLIMLILSHLSILISIINKLIQTRNKYIHVNDWITRPLMERYRSTLSTPEPYFQRRPPFIQAFRSNLVY